MEKQIASLDEMRELARALAAGLGPRALILLDGPVGAGKTQLTRFLLEALGSDETCSPSFAIHHSYQTRRGTVEHVDLYRIEAEDDLESTGFWDFFRAAEGVVIIEWAGRLVNWGLFDQLPRAWPRLHLKIEVPDDSGERRIVRVAQPF